MQLLDDGRLTDAHGRTVDFKNAVVIMTSNTGSQYLMEGGVDDQGHISDRARDLVMGELRQHFRPEFLNRVDDVVLFKPLTLPEIQQIVALMSAGLRQRLADRGIHLEMSEPACEFVARQGFDPVYGARPLKRFLQREVETRIGRALVAGQIGDGATVEVVLEDGQLAVRHENLSAGRSGANGKIPDGRDEEVIDVEVEE